MNNDEQRAAAYHEASHAVIAALLGGALGTVSITCDDGTWVGNTQVNWMEEAGSARKQKIFQVAVAGPFGQAKYRASLNWRGVTFDHSDCLEHILAIIREGELQEDSTPSLSFVAADGSKHVLEITDLNDLGDLEMLASLVQEFDDSVLIRLLGTVRDRLDSQAGWGALSEIAKSLCNRQLSGHEVDVLVHKHGLA